MAPKEESRKYRNKRQAKILDLIHYFGEDADEVDRPKNNFY